MNVYYQETSHRNYVVVSLSALTDTYVQAKINATYTLGIYFSNYAAHDSKFLIPKKSVMRVP